MELILIIAGFAIVGIFSFVALIIVLAVSVVAGKGDDV